MTESNMTSMTAAPLDLWPLLDRQDETFRLAHRWPIPSGIRLDGDKLRYDEGTIARWAIDPRPKLLTDFLTLADAAPETIARYAKRWGVLGLCEHGLIAGHDNHPKLKNESCSLLDAERLDSWRWCANQFRDLLEKAVVLRERGDLRPPSKRAHDEVFEFLRNCDWIVRYFGGLRPVLVVENGRFDIKLGNPHMGAGLPAALATQLLFTIAGAVGITTCASCGRTFMPRRRPRAGENSYCENCGIRAAWREAQRRRREKAERADRER